MRLLLVEDNADLADGLLRALRRQGYAVDWVADGIEADEILARQYYDLVVLDLGLPGIDGLDVLRRLRRRRARAPVLILTARGDLTERITGLDLGADDYLTKPFDLGEFEARIRVLLRRNQRDRAPHIKHGALVFDTVGRRVSVNGRPLEMPRRELCVLEILLSRVGQVVSKEQIAEQLFSYDDDTSLSAIEIYIHRLRKKLAPAGVSIRTVRGLGYLLEDE